MHATAISQWPFYWSVTLCCLFSFCGPNFCKAFSLFFPLVMVHVRGFGVYFTLLLVSSPRHLSISVQWKLRTTAGWVIPLGSRHYFPVTGNRWGFITLELSISKQSIPLILWILGGRFAVAVKVVCVIMMCHTVSLVLLICESSSLSRCEGLAFFSAMFKQACPFFRGRSAQISRLYRFSDKSCRLRADGFSQPRVQCSG